MRTFHKLALQWRAWRILGLFWCRAVGAEHFKTSPFWKAFLEPSGTGTADSKTGALFQGKWSQIMDTENIDDPFAVKERARKSIAGGRSLSEPSLSFPRKLLAFYRDHFDFQ